MLVDYKFDPLQFVIVGAYGLNYNGRIMRCEYNGQHKMYNVEYAADGKIESRMFYEDELCEKV